MSFGHDWLWTTWGLDWGLWGAYDDQPPLDVRSDEADRQSGRTWQDAPAVAVSGTVLRLHTGLAG